MKTVKRIPRAIVLVGLMPWGTYVYLSKRIWIHTSMETFLLVGLVVGGALMFYASTRPIDREKYEKFSE